MKRFILSMLLMFTLSFGVSMTTDAQVQYYRTTSFSYKQKTYGTWSNWTDWEKSDMTVTIDLTNDIIKIYSPKIQSYKVIAFEGSPSDSSGRQVKFKVIDQDGDIGYIRLRIENNGNSQIYVDFSNVMWVYNVRRTS